MSLVKMTIKEENGTFNVYKLKPQWSGTATDMAANKKSYCLDGFAKPRFSGLSFLACMAFIANSFADYVEI